MFWGDVKNFEKLRLYWEKNCLYQKKLRMYWGLFFDKIAG